MSEGRRIPDYALAEIRARLPLRAVIERRVQLRRTGAWWMGKCPFHESGSGSRNFGVRGDGDTFHCFGCGEHGDVITFVMRSEGCDFPTAAARCAQEAGISLGIDPGERPAAPPPAPARASPPPDRSATIARAWAWWEASRPIAPDGPVARYLAGRFLWPLPDDALAVLRETELEHKETGLALHPVMLARVDDQAGKLTAVHRTYLAVGPDGSVGKLGNVEAAKLAYGVLPAGSAIRLFPAAARLGAAEGIETALAAAMLHRLPVWSCISAGGLEVFLPPSGCCELVIFADRDKPRTGKVWRPEGQGMHSARVLAARAAERSVTARIRLPLPPAGDYADVLAARAGKVA